MRWPNWLRITPDLKRLPELRLVDDPQLRWDVLNRANHRLRWTFRIWQALLYVLLLLVLAFQIRYRFLVSSFIPLRIPLWLDVAMASLLVLGPIFLVCWPWLLVRQRRAIRNELLAVGIPVCLHCGYDLRGQTEPRCPECGKAFSKALLKE